MTATPTSPSTWLPAAPSTVGCSCSSTSQRCWPGRPAPPRPTPNHTRPCDAARSVWVRWPQSDQPEKASELRGSCQLDPCYRSRTPVRASGVRSGAIRGSLQDGKFVGFYLLAGVVRAAVSFDRGGDPE